MRKWPLTRGLAVRISFLKASSLVKGHLRLITSFWKKYPSASRVTQWNMFDFRLPYEFPFKSWQTCLFFRRQMERTHFVLFSSKHDSTTNVREIYNIKFHINSYFVWFEINILRSWSVVLIKYRPFYYLLIDLNITPIAMYTEPLMIDAVVGKYYMNTNLGVVLEPSMVRATYCLKKRVKSGHGRALIGHLGADISARYCQDSYFTFYTIGTYQWASSVRSSIHRIHFRTAIANLFFSVVLMQYFNRNR